VEFFRLAEAFLAVLQVTKSVPPCTENMFM